MLEKNYPVSRVVITRTRARHLGSLLRQAKVANGSSVLRQYYVCDWVDLLSCYENWHSRLVCF